MNQKLIAKSKVTGLYFNGVNFSESNILKATELHHGTTLEDMTLIWGGQIELLQLSRQAVEIASAPDPYMAARAFLKFSPARSHAIKLLGGKYVTRRVNIPAKSNEPAWIRFGGAEMSVQLINGELTT